MKGKWLFYVLLFTFFVLPKGTEAAAIKMMVDGNEIKSDVPPQIIKGRTMIPARFLAEALGAKVTWDANQKAVLVTTPNAPSFITESFHRGNAPGTLLVVDGSVIKSDVAPQLIQGRMMIPARFLAEELGASVDWKNQSVIVKSAETLATSPTLTLPEIAAILMNHEKQALYTILNALDWYGSNSKDYSEIKPQILSYYSNNITDSFEKTYKENSDYFAEPGWIFPFSYEGLKSSLKLVENTNNQLKVQFKTFGEESSLVTYTLLKQDGRWVIGNFQSQDILPFSKEEAVAILTQLYPGSTVKFLRTEKESDYYKLSNIGADTGTYSFYPKTGWALKVN